MRRSLFLFLIGLAVAVGLVAVAYGGWWVWGHVADFNQRMAAEGEVAAFGTFYLATVAGLVALLAYQIASQRPDLAVTIQFKDSDPNRPVLPYAPPPVEGAQLIAFDTTIDLAARIRLTNKAKYSARNPYVRLELVGLAGLSVPTEWKLVESGVVSGATEIAWEGHDRWVHDKRSLPTVDFAGVKMLRDSPPYRIDIHVAAEGFTKTFPIPLELITREMWNSRMAQKRHPH